MGLQAPRDYKQPSSLQVKQQFVVSYFKTRSIVESTKASGMQAGFAYYFTSDDRFADVICEIDLSKNVTDFEAELPLTMSYLRRYSANLTKAEANAEWAYILENIVISNQDFDIPVPSPEDNFNSFAASFKRKHNL